ncbi:hypothetical protein CDL12_30102 [Handroanthus impetiginosus]|uniref:Cytochrome P450 n=1 Tax=Handroanthus impetiginosus TaxID=429701 RepID=A0A2G9FWJ9_9LAMI|nr:hypothetical protein CDL12_30102 [Handroanthus impetiginosus]
MPALLRNSGRVHQYATEILERSGGTFLFKGLWFTNMEMLITSDPANFHYILTTNFSNFPNKSWENQRRLTKSLINHTRFQELVATTSWNKLETGLIPILELVSELGIEVDLQELFQRLAYDCTCILEGFDLLTSCMRALAKNGTPMISEEFWLGTMLNLIFAGIYLHGALCEALRLFPAVPFQHKAPPEQDILPRRMESIRGKDCLDFKAGRWISEFGCIKVEPSFKFTAFTAGRGSCLGKEMCFIHMKVATTAIISRFHIPVAESHSILPNSSVILHMKHDLKVKVSNYI